MIKIDQSKCMGCGECVADCFNGCLAVIDGKANVVGSRCTECGHCFAVCPSEAIIMENRDRANIKPFNQETMTMDAQHLADFMRFRRSTRRFTQERVTDEQLKAIIEAGRYSPTGSNRQTTGYIVLQDSVADIRRMVAKALEKLSDEPARAGYSQVLKQIAVASREEDRDLVFYDAPAVIIVIDNFGDINGALAASRMELQANALGLGACFIGFFAMAAANDTDLRDVIGLPEGYHVVTSLAIGHPDVVYRRTVARREPLVIWQ